jgi:hypothetical protein
MTVTSHYYCVQSPPVQRRQLLHEGFRIGQRMPDRVSNTSLHAFKLKFLHISESCPGMSPACSCTAALPGYRSSGPVPLAGMLHQLNSSKDAAGIVTLTKAGVLQDVL